MEMSGACSSDTVQCDSKNASECNRAVEAESSAGCDINNDIRSVRVARCGCLSCEPVPANC